MNETRKKLYDEWRENYGTDPAKSVGWRNQESLDKRFIVTLSHLARQNFTTESHRILDVGCGCSLNLLRYLPIENQIYVGIDCNDESLKSASHSWDIPYNGLLNSHDRHQLLFDETLGKVNHLFFDVIIVQGVYQEFDSIKDIMKHVKTLSEMLAENGEMIILTPSNRLLDAEGRSVLKISPYDAISILENTGLPYELFLGELGEHIIMRIYRKDN